MNNNQFQPQLFNFVFRQDNLDRLFIRNEEFKKLFLCLQKFLTENYSNFSQYGKSIQKAALNLDDYLKNYIANEKNCFNFGKYISTMLTKFGEDFSRIFFSLSEELNIALEETVEKIVFTKKNYLEISAASINVYMHAELNYLKILQKYKKFCHDVEDCLQAYEDSQQEAKSIYNLSIVHRHLNKVRGCVGRVNKYEIKLKNAIELLNTKRKAFSINVLETISHFKINYKFCLVKFFEFTKKHSDAISSFLSIFAQLIHEKKLEISEMNLSTNLPCSSDFIFPNSSKNNKLEVFPEFLRYPEKLSETNILDFADWIQNYGEKMYVLSQHRRKILKHIKICIGEFGEAHDFLSKGVQKILKNVLLVVNWNVFGEYVYNLGQHMNLGLEMISKKLAIFAGFVVTKITSLESLLQENVKSLKIVYASINKTIKDHALIRNNLLKSQNNSKNKAIPFFTTKGEPSNLKEIQENLKTSMIETASNLKALLHDFSKEEYKRAVIFKETMEVIISQMEFYYTEIVESLKTYNERTYKSYNKLFTTELESMFNKLVVSDPKINELYKPNFVDLLNQEKDNEVVFISEFNAANHSLYQKIFNNSSSEDIPDPNERIDNSDEEIANEKPEDIDSENLNIQPRTHVPPSIISSDYMNYMIPKRKKSLDSPRFDDNNANINSVSVNPLNTPKENIIRPSRCESDISPIKLSQIDRSEKIESKPKLSVSNMKNNLNLDPEQMIEELANSPKKKKSTYAFFNSKFGLVKDEVIDEVFSCALLDKIVIQGKLFISNKKLAFHSYFNRFTLLGETKMIIPKKDILRIEKRYNALIFDNSIAVITLKGEVFFTSFVFRDRAYISIIKTLTPVEQKDIPIDEKPEETKEKPEINLEKDDVKVLDEEKIIDPETLIKLEERANIVKSLHPKEEYFKEITYTHVLPVKCRLDDVVRIIYAGIPYTYKGKTFKSGFFEFLKTERSGDTQLLITEFEPPIPPYYLSKDVPIEELVSAVHMSERRMEYIHPVKKTGIPFIPKTCPVKEVHKMYWINNKELFYINEAKSEKVPYSDCFNIVCGFRIKELDNCKIETSMKLQIIFVKKTYLQGTLERAVIEENGDAIRNIVYPSMIEWFTAIFKSKEYQDKYPSVALKEAKEEIQGEEKKLDEEGKLEEAKPEGVDRNEEKIKILEEKLKMAKLVIGLMGMVYLMIIVKLFLDYF